MAYRYDDLAPGEVYHICTRGVEQRDIFRHDNDRRRFSKLLKYYLPPGKVQSFSLAPPVKQEGHIAQEGAGLIDLLAYCLMTNHVHLLVRENVEGGISQYMHRVLTSYARYFNMSEHRSGSLFLNPFRAVLVDGDEQLLHVSRYIHLNPYVAHMVKDPLAYQWSTLSAYAGRAKESTCHTSLLLSMMSSTQYKKFVTDEADYARSLADIQHLLVDDG
jgi:putative transposase